MSKSEIRDLKLHNFGEQSALAKSLESKNSNLERERRELVNRLEAKDREINLIKEKVSTLQDRLRERDDDFREMEKKLDEVAEAFRGENMELKRENSELKKEKCNLEMKLSSGVYDPNQRNEYELKIRVVTNHKF